VADGLSAEVALAESTGPSGRAFGLGLFHLDGRAAIVTGHILAVDGGYTAM